MLNSCLSFSLQEAAHDATTALQCTALHCTGAAGAGLRQEQQEQEGQEEQQQGGEGLLGLEEQGESQQDNLQ